MALASLAKRQHGLAKTAQLIEAGLSHNGIKQRVARGALHRRHRGVYSIGHAALSREAEMHAAVLAACDGSALSREAAAEHLQVRRHRAKVISVVTPRRCFVAGVQVHYSRHLSPLDIVIHRGIPVTNVARLLVDLSDTLTAEELANVIHEAAFRKWFDLAATRRAMQRANGRHNLHALEVAIDLYLSGSVGTRSRLEVASLQILKLADLPAPLVNSKVMNIEVDLHWPDRKLVVEIDGPPHARPTSRRTDARRDAALRAAGWTVLRFKKEDVEQRPERVREQIKGYLCTP